MTATTAVPQAHRLGPDLRPGLSSDEVERRWAAVVVDELGRRGFLAGLAGAAVLAAGCGRPDSTEAAGGGSDTVRAETPFGTFDVPLAPQRVIVLEGRQDLETAVVLGMPRPVGLGDNAVDAQGRTAAFVGFDAEGIELMPGGQVNLEMVAALRPDLIIGRASNIEPVAAELARFAPLVPVEVDETTWRPDLEAAGRWTGRSDRVAAAIARYEESVRAFRDRHAAALAQAAVAVLQPGTDGAWYSSPSDGFLLQGRTLRDLGGRPVPAIEEVAPSTPGGMSEFSGEQLGLLTEADVLLVASFTEEQRAGLESSPLWSRLPVVRAGRVVHTDIRTNRGSVLAANECVRLWDQAYSLLG
ncbi:ABC transporter substrate-binding protein [Pseudonocardia xishanensis]|uniref:Iron-siderophore ABC transporter substrate-binding protein n=1 Tax=Pseudonocardia xishanensis TaxID=630995 RepID=A0ABP8RRY0_9PSEU